MHVLAANLIEQIYDPKGELYSNTITISINGRGHRNQKLNNKNNSKIPELDSVKITVPNRHLPGSLNSCRKHATQQL